MNLVHHHYIYQANVRKDLGNKSEHILKEFLYNLVSEINMEVLINPILKYSHNDAWTGLIGIVTSHISFHYWVIDGYLQLDIYSCKEFDIKKTRYFLDSFWQSTNVKSLFINRENNKDFEVTIIK
jgi:S-adenosylmethionine/arginine decarboxylase-like enzyme